MYKPTLAQLVERRTVVGNTCQIILRSLVRIRQVGLFLFFPSFSKTRIETKLLSSFPRIGILANTKIQC